ncbi:transposase [Sulfurivirga caldicuralii]|uniref:transposase n=1 Tax=Sulfurivirga caldicuralii TaxID=364032 RepID=UPI0009411BA2
MTDRDWENWWGAYSIKCLSSGRRIKVREQQRVVTKAVLLVSGINAEGYREVLGIRMGDKRGGCEWVEQVIKSN